MQPEWDNWLERLYDLRRDKSGPHERPHKPVLLLSIIDLIDRGLISSNAVPLSEELVATFKRYFEIVRKHNDQPTIQNPFFFLRGDKFWQLVPRPGKEAIYRPGATSGAPSVRQLREAVQFGRFEHGLWQLLAHDISRHQLREALITRYLPGDREKLAALAATSRNISAAEVLREEPPEDRRDPAFRKKVVRVYDFRCAACGIRVLLPEERSLVEAAHLIPVNVQKNDNPTNGMALCPNHHWAMDGRLIAPCPDTSRRAGVWRVNDELLDERIEGQRDLFGLDGKPVIPPKDKAYYPAIESLRWREAFLRARQ